MTISYFKNVVINHDEYIKGVLEADLKIPKRKHIIDDLIFSSNRLMADNEFIDVVEVVPIFADFLSELSVSRQYFALTTHS
jgi:hypothetical protein